MKKPQKSRPEKANTSTQGAEPERVFSLQSARSKLEELRLQREKKACEANVELWERRHATAEAGKKRQAAQIAAGHGYAHTALLVYVQEVLEAQQMIATFKEQAKALQTRIDNLTLNAAEADERRKNQESVAALLDMRVITARRLDGALQDVRRIAGECLESSAEIARLAGLLEFPSDTNLGVQQFEDLLRKLPKEMAPEAERFATWFLGMEEDRKPCLITVEQVTLPETLRSSNVFVYGERPELTREEARRVAAIETARYIPTPQEQEAATRLPGEAARELPIGMVQWGLLR